MNKKILIIFFLLLTYTIGLAQKRDIIIKGELVDSLLNQIIPKASIILMSNNKEVKSLTSNDQGIFVVKITDSIDTGFNIIISHINFKKKIFSLTKEKDKFVYDMGSIFLELKENNLDEINIVRTQAVLKRKIDRITYDVQQDPDRRFETLYDMIQKVPLVSIDGMDGLAVKGNKNFKILVNGKESILFSNNPAQAMKTLQASEIISIEVITNPPAKYDSEGATSLINIVTKKRVDNGYDISLATLYNFPYGPMANFNTSYKVNKLKFNFLGSIFNQTINPLPFSGVTSYKTSGTQLNQEGTQEFQGNSTTLSGNISYEVDSLNLISIGISNRDNDFERKINTISSNKDIKNISQNGDVRWTTNLLDFNYQKVFKQHPNHTIEVSYKYQNTSNKEEDFISFNDPNIFSGKQNNLTQIVENSVQIDYEQPFKYFSIESGAKYINRKNNSTYSNVSSKLENNFNYDYSVINLYHSFSLEREKWAFKGGGRLDIAKYPKKYNKNSNVKFLPSISIQRSLSEKSSLNLSYNKQIMRPNILQLNPFIDSSNYYFLNSGNPLLNPVIGHNTNLSFNYFNKVSIYAELGYSQVNNAIERILQETSDDKLIFNYLNIGKKRDFNSSLNIGYNYKKMRFTINSMISYINLSSNYNNSLISNDGWISNSSLIFSLAAPYKFRAGVRLRYNTPDITLQGKTYNYFNSSFTLSKNMFNDKFSAFVSLNNPFAKLYNARSSYFTDFGSSYSNSKMNYRSFVLTLSYNLNSGNTKQRKSKRSIKNDDQKEPELNLFK